MAYIPIFRGYVWLSLKFTGGVCAISVHTQMLGVRLKKKTRTYYLTSDYAKTKLPKP